MIRGRRSGLGVGGGGGAATTEGLRGIGAGACDVAMTGGGSFFTGRDAVSSAAAGAAGAEAGIEKDGGGCGEGKRGNGGRVGTKEGAMGLRDGGAREEAEAKGFGVGAAEEGANGGAEG